MSKLISEEANWNNILANESGQNCITPQTLNVLTDEHDRCDSKISKINPSDDKWAHQATRQARKLKSSFMCEAEVRRNTYAEYKEKTMGALNQKTIAGELDKLRQNLAKLKRINASTNKIPLAPRPLRTKSHKICLSSRDTVPSLDIFETEEERSGSEKMFESDDVTLDLRSWRQSFISMPPLRQLGPRNFSIDSLCNEVSLPSVCENSLGGSVSPEKGPNTTPTSLYRGISPDEESVLDMCKEKNGYVKSGSGDSDSQYCKSKVTPAEAKTDISQERLELPQYVTIPCDEYVERADNNRPQGKTPLFKQQFEVGRSHNDLTEVDQTKNRIVYCDALEVGSQAVTSPKDSVSIEEALKRSELERKRQVQKRAYSKWMSYVCNRTTLNARNHQKPEHNNFSSTSAENGEKICQREEKIAMVLGYIDRMKKYRPTNVQAPSKSVTPPSSHKSCVTPMASIDVKTARASSGPFENRFQAQRDLIRKQKVKLDEQEKKIQELTLARLQEEAKTSHKELIDTLDHLVEECTMPIRSQMRSLKASASQQDFSTPGRFVERMEQRAKERELKKHFATERRKMQEEERKKKMKDEEEKRIQEEEEKKRQAMERAREESIRRREIRELTRKEQEKMFQLGRQADRFNERRLCLLGLRAFKNLLVRKQVLEWQAEERCRKRIMMKALLTWKISVDEQVAQREAVAVAFYNEKLLKRAFSRWKQAVEDSIRQTQVAEDMYEMRLQEKVFRKWCQYTTEQHVRMTDRLAEADDHYNRCILKKYFRLWRKYPYIAHFEREKERRKTILRQKVQNMLPDFRPLAPEYY